ncbi:type II restriction endonuclease, partial [Candidatus Saccharibacteria bacterium]|nr:type II restriction endonuclease [Candidatus Saccharibacteria bacterium]
MQQNGCETNFAGCKNWVVLNPIEQSIKTKIEKVGTPLKNWNISIYRGILTGCNDAFIIDEQKRNEILECCKTEDEKKRTAELIRPILRGRDIKRYGYDWANLYLIATFPSRHYDIEDFPAIKEYLLSFGMERLEQTGKKYKIKGDDVHARKKTNNKWFETQDSISYWEDFS